MKAKIIGTWKNLDESIQLTLHRIPGNSDEYSLEFQTDKKSFNENIHISNTDNIIWHIVDNDTLGAGFLKFLTTNEIQIKTAKFDDLKLIKND
jgi:hypothetical protein